MNLASLPRHASPDGVATCLGVSTKTVQRLYQTGRLPASKVGRRVLIPLREVEALLRRSPVAAPATATAVDAQGEAIPFAAPGLRMRTRRALAALADDAEADDPPQVAALTALEVPGLGIGAPR